MKVVETRYAGRRFRSRTEARYAVLFDALTLDWDYEPEGFQLDDGSRYLPDFFVRYPEGSGTAKAWPGAGYWVEIKAGTPTPADISKLSQVAKGTGHLAYLFAGQPNKAESWCMHRRTWEMRRDHFGLDVSAPVLLCSARRETRLPFAEALAIATSARFEFGENGR